MAADGTRQRPLTHLRKGQLWGSSVMSSLDWSPDSPRIAFNGDRGMIHVMNADGAHPRSLDRYGANPSWSAGGRWFLFRSTAENENPVEPDW